MKNQLQFGVVCILAIVSQARADDLSATIAKIRPEVLSLDQAAGEMLERDISRRLQASNRNSSEAWRAVKNRDDWEQLRNRTIESLRKSLGPLPKIPNKISIHITKEIKEAGYVIRNIVFQSRPGLLVTANLYVPATPSRSMPGILLSHSHHSPKSQGELQDMGALWARSGCLVLVPDHLGHGERRQHPFVTANDYVDRFQIGRQDYYFRFNTAIQLYLGGESLMGWMAWDLMRGVDVLLAQPGVDANRIALLGAVAGGGDPAAVAAALDSRIKVVVPFNFGGPQPETRYPLPDNAEEQFDYAGGGSWESTRNLYRSASDGFLPWMIVGSVAPRGLIHAHEFSWDQDHDPVWKRYLQIYSYYDAKDRLGFTHGIGLLRQQPPQASHCDNIGKPHRKLIHEYFERLWGIKVDAQTAVARHSADELACLTNTADLGLMNKPLHQLVSELAANRRAEFLDNLGSSQGQDRLDLLGNHWAKILGDATDINGSACYNYERVRIEGLQIERRGLYVTSDDDRELQLPSIMLLPQPLPEKLPIVVAIAQEGKEGFLKRRSALLAKLLKFAAVCLIDLRGTGELKPDNDRGRRSNATSLAASELMLGKTRLAGQLRDLRTTLFYLRMLRKENFSHVVLWGDSLASVNEPGMQLERPLDVDQPALAEPMGPTLVLLAGLFEVQPMIIIARGGLVDYRSLLESQFIHVPFDMVVPGAAALGDLPEVAKIVSTQHSLRMSGFVDGRNRAANQQRVIEQYGTIAKSSGTDEEIIQWLLEELTKKR